jgi:hypothetical protein
MKYELDEFLQQWVQQHPGFTGSLEIHFRAGAIADVHSHQKHRDMLKLPKEQDHAVQGR